MQAYALEESVELPSYTLEDTQDRPNIFLIADMKLRGIMSAQLPSNIRYSGAVGTRAYRVDREQESREQVVGRG